MRKVVHLAALFTMLAAGAPVMAQVDPDGIEPQNEAPWRILLKDQLKAEQGCDLNEVLTYQEIPLGEDVGVDGRISCFDKREFNFTRKGKQQKFSIEICTPAVC